MADRICIVPGCSRKHASRGWCSSHYQRWRNTGDVQADSPWKARGRACAVANCDGGRVFAHGMCAAHYRRWQAHGDVLADVPVVRRRKDVTACSVVECGRRSSCRGYCGLHYQRWRRHGDPLQLTWRQGCAVEGCLGAHRSAGYCGLHFDRYRTHGDPGELERRRVVRYSPEQRPAAGVANAARRRAREREAMCEHGPQCVTADVIAEIRAAECMYCGKQAEHADHFEPLHRGGIHCRDNLVPACAFCNASKGKNDPWEWWAERLQSAAN